MNIEIWLAFVLTATVILAIPGPTIIYVIGQSLTHGNKAVLPLATGVVLGDATCILFSLLGLSAILVISSVAFTIIKFFGAGYLIYLGFSMLKQGMNISKLKSNIQTFNFKSMFKSVFIINSLNPKGIIFYSAFMPQFVDLAGNIYNQFLILGFTFLTLAFLNTLIYSLLSGKLSQIHKSENVTQWFSYGGGVALVGAGVITAVTNHK